MESEKRFARIGVREGELTRPHASSSKGGAIQGGGVEAAAGKDRRRPTTEAVAAGGLGGRGVAGRLCPACTRTAPHFFLFSGRDEEQKQKEEEAEQGWVGR